MEGFIFNSQTDTEIIAILIQKYRDQGFSEIKSIEQAL